MNCPVDGAELQMTERQGIEIDYCPRCRGVWLDRGELDKIVDRSADVPARLEAAPSRERDAEYRREYRDDDDRDDYRPSDRGYDPRRRKRRSFLEDLFDID